MNKKTLYIAIAAASVVLLVLIGLLLWEPVVDALPIDQSGWKDRDGQRIYLDEDGDPLTGWQTLDDERYYFDPDTGAMHTGWLELNGQRYHFDPEGAQSIGWITTADGSFYLLSDGTMATSWQEIEGETYCFAEAGTLLTGWQDLEGKRYYFDGSGVLCSGWVEVEGTSYYLDEDGSLYSGWMSDGSCYILSDGTMATSWQEIDGVHHLFNEDGSPVIGWQESDEGRRHFSATGAMQLGWQEIDGSTYYFTQDGTAAIGKLVIDGQNHYFTSTGANILLVNRWNMLPDDYEPGELVESLNGSKVTPECAAALEKMIADCKAAGFNPKVHSSYRTIAHQKTLLAAKMEEYDYNKAIQIVAIPGTSEHHTGDAVDIVDAAFTTLNREQASRPTQQWLLEHCWEYGFIVRYPDGTTDITGIIYEPWHYRYVGLELATELKEKGICLEEYLDQLTNDGTSCGGRTYETTEPTE